MNKLTIYLGKSNKCEPLHYAFVQKALNNLGVTVLEWEVGQDVNSNLAMSDALLLIMDSVNTFGTVGKGLYQNIEEILYQQKPAYAIVSIDEEEITPDMKECIIIDRIISVEKYEKSDPRYSNGWVTYGLAHMSGENMYLEDIDLVKNDKTEGKHAVELEDWDEEEPDDWD